MNTPPPVPADGDAIARAKALLTANGHVVLTASSYRRAQERQHRAESRAEWESERRESTERWAREQLLPRERFLSDRLAFVYGVARAHGASVEDLSGDLLDSTDPRLRRNIQGVLRDAAIAGNWTVGVFAQRIRTLIESPHYLTPDVEAETYEASDAP